MDWPMFKVFRELQSVFKTVRKHAPGAGFGGAASSRDNFSNYFATFAYFLLPPESHALRGAPPSPLQRNAAIQALLTSMAPAEGGATTDGAKWLPDTKCDGANELADTKSDGANGLGATTDGVNGLVPF